MCKKCVCVAAYTICNKYGCSHMDIISWTYWIYSMMDWPLVDVISVLVWRVLIRGGCRAMWCVVSLCWPGSIVGWVHWPSAHRSISPVVVELACKMTPNSSFSFLCCMFLITPWFVLDFHIHVYCWGCVMRVPSRVTCFDISCMFTVSYFIKLPVCYMFCIVIYIFH